MRLRNIFLECRDFPRTAAFYADVLGLAVERRSDRLLHLWLGNVGLHLHGPLSQEERDRYGLKPPREASQSLVLSLEVADVDGLAWRAAHFGARLRCHPMDAPWGDRLAIVEDPEGNLIELATPTA